MYCADCTCSTHTKNEGVMDVLTILILSFGLAMDCFAVSISKGVCTKNHKLSNTLKMAIVFGAFQALMPCIGFALGVNYASQIKDYDHWIAFLLLLAIGIKMIYEGVRHDYAVCEKEIKPYQWKTLFILGFATSIDALATGLLFVSYPDRIGHAALLIGITSFFLSCIGMYIGLYFGKKFNLKVEIIGGLLLIGIGLKILIEHLHE